MSLTNIRIVMTIEKQKGPQMPLLSSESVKEFANVKVSKRFTRTSTKLEAETERNTVLNLVRPGAEVRPRSANFFLRSLSKKHSLTISAGVRIK